MTYTFLVCTVLLRLGARGVVGYVLGVAVLNFLLGAAIAALQERSAPRPKPRPQPAPPPAPPADAPPEPDDDPIADEVEGESDLEAEEEADVEAEPEETPPPALHDALGPVFQLDLLGCRARLITLRERLSSDAAPYSPEASDEEDAFLEAWLADAAAAGARLEESRAGLGELLPASEEWGDRLTAVRNFVEPAWRFLTGAHPAPERIEQDELDACIENLHALRDDRYELRLAAVEEFDQFASLPQQDLVDPQTRLHNLLGLEEVHRHWRSDLAAAGTHCSLVVLDVDGFSAVNERIGYEAGDRLLAAFGALADDLLRKDRGFDRAIRRRGNCFVLFLGETDADNAARAAERIRQTIEASSFILAGEEIDLTVSVGVAGGSAEEPVWDALSRAAEAADCAKSAGGNRTACYTESGPQVEQPRPYQVKGRAVKLDVETAP